MLTTWTTLPKLDRPGRSVTALPRMKAVLLSVVTTLGLAGTASACTVYARPAPAVVTYSAPPPVEDGYEPQYYDGYVVYYDDVGRPYYYDGDRTVFISPNVAVYGSLVAHWRVHRVAYGRWYAHRGPAYRGYRRR